MLYEVITSLERLSGEMHKHFDKCSGFIAYQSENDALIALSESQTFDGNTRLIDYSIDNPANVSQLVASTQEPRVRQMIP